MMSAMATAAIFRKFSLKMVWESVGQAAVMASIQAGEMEASTSLNDATAYRLLADLIDASVARS